MVYVQLLPMEAPCQAGSQAVGQPLDGARDNRSIEWDLLTERFLLNLGAPFSFEVGHFDLWANCKYLSELEDAARTAARARAQEASPPQACGPQEQAQLLSPSPSQPVQLGIAAAATGKKPSTPEAQAPDVEPRQASLTPSQSVQQTVHHNTPPQALSSPVAMPGTGMRYLEIASAPPVLPGQSRVPRLELASPHQLFAESMQPAEQLNESHQTVNPVVVEEDAHNASSASPQCTPMPSEVFRPPKLSIRTPVEGVPELHHSALRDTPSRSTAPLISLCPPTHVEGVPETNVHLPMPRLGTIPGTSSVSTALTPPSQIEGVPEIRMSAWAPPARPRLSANEDSVGDACLSSIQSQHDASHNTTSQHAADAPQQSPAQGAVNQSAPVQSPDVINQVPLNTCSPPRSRITHPTPAPSHAYIIPDHPVLLNSKPSPVLSPRSRLIRESTSGIESPQQANAEQPKLTPEAQAIPLRLPSSEEHSRENSSRPSTAEGSISLKGDAAPPDSVGAQTQRISASPAAVAHTQDAGMYAPPNTVGEMLPPMSAQAWFQKPSGLTPQGHVSVAVGTTPTNSALGLPVMNNTPADSSMGPEAVHAAPENPFLGLLGHNAHSQGNAIEDIESDDCDDFPEDPLATPPDERVSSQHERARSSQEVQVDHRPALIPRHVDRTGTRQSLPAEQESQQAQQFMPAAAPSTVAPKSILKTAKLPSTAGRSSAMKCPRRSEQENLWSGGNAVDTRTPHFQLPPSGDDQHFSGSGPHAMDPDENLSQSEQISQGHSEGNGGEQEEGDGAASGKKKKSRGAHSLMSRHLRRKSLAMAGTKEVDGRRVSTRRKMKPLRWWCSETKTYCRKHQSALLCLLLTYQAPLSRIRGSGVSTYRMQPSPQDVVLCHGLPTVQAVIRTEQKSAQYRGLKNPADSFQAHMEAWDTK